MHVDREQLKTAVAQGVISDEQAQKLWAMLEADQSAVPRFNFTNVLYYLGGMIAIGGVSVYVTLAWELLGGLGLFLIAAIGIAVAYWLTQYFLDEKRLPIPAGIMAALMVALVPLGVYGLQKAFGFWESDATYRDYHRIIDWRWIIMELATLAGGALVLRRFGLPFSVMPIAVTLWYMSMDLAPLIQQIILGVVPPDKSADWRAQQPYWTQLWELRKWVSLVFGLAVTALAFRVDLRTLDRRDFSFWLYMAGVAAFWGGLTSMNSGSEIGKFIYFLINLGMILVGAAIARRVFTVFGAMGVAMYLGHLSYKVFKDSLLFPVILTLLGLGIVWLGMQWQRHEPAITAALRERLPLALRELIERRAG